MDIYEIIGFVTGVLCVALLIRQNIWNWPISIVNAVFYIVVFFNAKLYADVGLQCFFIVINSYGWYEWLHGGNEGGKLTLSRMSMREWALSAAVIAGGTYVLGSLLHYTTDAAMPFADSLATVMSLTAQFLMARKKLENWLIWIAVNCLYIVVYFYRGLFLTQILYVIYLGLAILAWIAWRKSFRNQVSA